MLDDAPNQPSKFITKNWVKINDESRGTYNEDNQIRFKTLMLRSSLCNCSNAYILVKETIAFTTVSYNYSRNYKNKQL